MINKLLNRKIFIIPIILIAGCSAEKNTFTSREYQNLISHYNVYFNANESLKNGLKKITAQHTDNYTKILKPFIYGEDKLAKMVVPDMDKTIKKCSKLIKLHSITAKPKRKKGRLTKSQKEFYNKKEYNNWVDDAYLLMGKAHFYKHDYATAQQTFEYLIKEYNDQEIKYDGYIWLARTANEQKKYGDARTYLDRLESDKRFPSKMRGEFEIVFADHFLKQGNYDEAVPRLINAIKYTRKRADRARYKFILAQVYQLKGDNIKATEMYGEVIKMNPYYEMTFNARINRANTYNAGDPSGSEIKKELAKMLKDDKNIDYQDQIYYALGNIAMKEGNEDKALEYYKLSAKASLSNIYQKSRTFLSLADIFYNHRDYRNSQVYYDSTMLFLENDYPGYDLLSQKSKSLNNLVENLNIISREDSLQKVAKMKPEERNKLIDKIIEKVKEDERKAKEAERQAMMSSSLFKQNQREGRMGSATAGKWYFYNPTAMSFGQSEFVKVWGKRKLEDNWRRKNKNVVMPEELSDKSEEENDSIAKMKKKLSDNKSREYYLVNLPLTDSLMAQSTQKIINAYFNGGEIFKTEIEDYTQSAKMFKDLNDRFPENKFVLYSYYNLYDLGRISEKKDMENMYRELIISKYPDSKFAKMFTNPNYLKEFETEQEQAKSLYTETYSYYTKKNYQTVITKCTQAETQFKETDIMPKFKYMKALAYGESGHQDDMVKMLNDIIKNYPKSEVKPPASNILAMMNKDNKNANTDKSVTEQHADSVPASNEEKIYKYEEKTSYFYVVVLKAKGLDANRLKYNLTNFNIDKYPSGDFSVTAVLLNNDYQLIIVKTLESKNQGMNYYDNILHFKDEIFKDYPDYKHFMISSSNYAVLYKDQDIDKYLKYFRKHYLTGK
ncbi:MAG: tetratricopeptide repeat protein [Bacteroidia bacterium]|nr:tetratricopeptide repeat protein [Bacteroidia bacterium]